MPQILWFILLLGVLVTVHELGHFLVAKACGVKVLKFSFGFGPKLLSFTKGETEYQIALLPLGGFVKMAGDIPGEGSTRCISA
jgi:regulator of sigma E protease